MSLERFLHTHLRKKSVAVFECSLTILSSVCRCVIPHCDNGEYPAYNQTFLPFTIPTTKDGSYESCARYLYVNKTSPASIEVIPTVPNTCSADRFSKITIEDCPEGYVFDQSIYQSTIVTEVIISNL